MEQNPYKNSLHEGDGRRARAWELGYEVGYAVAIRDCADKLRHQAHYAKIVGETTEATALYDASKVLDLLADKA